MNKAKCVRECVWQRRHWKVGEIYEGAETPPRHFQEIATTEIRSAEGGEEPKRGRKKKEDGEED